MRISRLAGLGIAISVAAWTLSGVLAAGTQTHALHQFAAAPQNDRLPQGSQESGNKDAPSPAEVMARRYPQPTKAGALIGLPVLDWNDSTIGFVQDVVRTREGNVQLIVPYSPRFGWLRARHSPVAKRLVAVPIEKVAILARQIASLEMSREDFDAASTWDTSAAVTIPAGETIRIALTRR